MNKYYKLTDQHMRTYKGFQWKLHKTVTTSGQGELCTDGWIHCYNDPLLAVLLNPIHANFNKPRIFEILVGGKFRDDRGLKFGWAEVTLINEVPLPTISDNQKIAFAIHCAKAVHKEKKWVIWADGWLQNIDRSSAAAYTAAYAAGAAADAAAYADRAAADAAYTAADAAAYADRAAADAYAAYAADAAAYAAYAAAYAAADAAAYAAAAAEIDLISIAHKVKLNETGA